ncbi:MAG: uracil-DNA glycosylase [Betaproteobacteria bacterium]|nr:uracil-DNA glycosylase [Betaproteobacteria bacterium]
MKSDKLPQPLVNCRRCKHYYVTWDESFPQGCRLYGVKSRQAPSIAVRDATGAACQFWEAKPFAPSTE